MRKMEERDEGKRPPACKPPIVGAAIEPGWQSIPKFRSGRAIAKGPRNVSFPDWIGYLGTATVRILSVGLSDI